MGPWLVDGQAGGHLSRSTGAAKPQPSTQDSATSGCRESDRLGEVLKMSQSFKLAEPRLNILVIQLAQTVKAKRFYGK